MSYEFRRHGKKLQGWLNVFYGVFTPYKSRRIVHPRPSPDILTFSLLPIG